MSAEERAGHQAGFGTRRRGMLGAGAALLAAMLSLAVPLSSPAQELQPSPQENVSLQEAIEIATARQPGQVVRAQTLMSRNGRRVHQVRILLAEGGRVVDVRVDALTGAVQ